jgi:preprotein translocase subunit SecE
MAQINPFKFLQEVRAEEQKVTWPTRKETTVTTMMVFVMVILATIFFLVADQIMRLGTGYLLGHQLLGRAGVVLHLSTSGSGERRGNRLMLPQSV